jgi:hypothetical protein
MSVVYFQDVMLVKWCEKQHTRCSSEKLITQNFHRVEPVQRLWLTAVRHSFAQIPFTEAPKPDLVEIMQSQRLRNSVDEREVWYTGRDDMAQVEANKVPILDNGLVAYARYVDEDEEDEGEEEEERCGQRPYFACSSCAFDLLLGEFRDDSR